MPAGSASPTASTSCKPSCASCWITEPPQGSALLHGRGKDVAPAAHRLDQCRVAGVGFQLLAQSSNLRVDGPVVSRPIAALRQLDKLIAAEHPVGMTREGAQQLELPGGEGREVAAGAPDFALDQIQLPAV